MMKLLVNNPNLSIILPGPCNAHCDFCFWDRNAKVMDGYLVTLRRVLSSLPLEFDQISITGGEPTLSPLLAGVLTSIDRNRWKKVVLTTNGTGLGGHFPGLIGATVDHLNLSRHSFSDAENATIFKSKTIPTTDQIEQPIRSLWRVFGVDTTINTVIKANCEVGFISGMIEYAKIIGAKCSSFRLEHGDMAPSSAEQFYTTKYPVDDVQTCPTYATVYQTIQGHKVNWKRATLEPSLDMGGIYESIIQQDCSVTVDWQGKVPMVLDPKPKRRLTTIISEYSASYGSPRGCGSSSGC
jgi:molybdenum cofactor biosynthesis enzyme MoaA